LLQNQLLKLRNFVYLKDLPVGQFLEFLKYQAELDLFIQVADF
jgi:hypothetical protein